ncbi:MAG: hypothetical protein HQ559_09130 [Lentisphaerae bacterium]|nr:hypothetical protein [Lentisphaerota bacterium]
MAEFHPVVAADGAASNVVGGWSDKSLGKIVVVAIRKWWSSLKRPDPWDAETDDEVRSREATPVCHRCFHPVTAYTAFCPHCNTAVGLTNNLHPYWRLFSIGEVARSGIGEHAHFTKLNVVGYAFFGLSQYGFLAPVYFLRLLQNYRKIRRKKRASNEESPAHAGPTVG